MIRMSPVPDVTVETLQWWCYQLRGPVHKAGLRSTKVGYNNTECTGDLAVRYERIFLWILGKFTGSSQDTQDQVTITYETLKVKFFSTAIRYMNNDLFDLAFRILDVRIDSSRRTKHIPMCGRKSSVHTCEWRESQHWWSIALLYQTRLLRSSNNRPLSPLRCHQTAYMCHLYTIGRAQHSTNIL